MPKIRCICDAVIPLGEIPSPNQLLVIPDVAYDNFQGMIDAEHLYREMTLVVRCPDCCRLYFYWNGFGKEPQVYQVNEHPFAAKKTFPASGYAFQEVIELETLEKMMHRNENKLMVALLLAFTDELNRDERLRAKYQFEVISFGFMGYYPVIGVQYLADGLPAIEEFVVKRYDWFAEHFSAASLLEFIFANESRIAGILQMIREDNDKFYKDHN